MLILLRFFKTCWKPRRTNRIQDYDETEIPLSTTKNPFPSIKSHTPEEQTYTKHPTTKPKSTSILDPRGRLARRWNLFFFVACTFSLFVDPVFFLIPEASPEFCIVLGATPKVVLIVLRSVTDLFYVVNIIVKFHTAFVAPSSRVIGRGELVTEPWLIAKRYVRFRFWVDLAASLPLPQVFIWAILPSLKGSTTSHFNTYLMFSLTVLSLQTFLRFTMAYPQSLQLCKTSGIITENNWLGAAYTIIFYLFPCIAFGNCWYILAVQRQKHCWDTICNQETGCLEKYFDCSYLHDPNRIVWIQSSNISTFCDPDSNLYPYGIYGLTVSESITSGGFLNKVFYCIWWGVANISTQGQNLFSSMNIAENIFCLVLGVVGLVLFVFVLGKIQNYVRCHAARLDEWRLQQTDLDQWMKHRQLPKELKQSILNYYNYKWVATQGINEEVLLKQLPISLQRKTKRYLCLNLVQQVPLFNKLDDRTLEGICERLNPTLYTKGTYILHEGDPVDEMFFIMRGHLHSYTFPDYTKLLGPNEFCGEELLSWVLDTHQTYIMTSSTRTVKAVSDVEGFAIKAEDLKFITVQFKGMHSKELRDKLRYYSHQWRMWAVCFIQAAWRRHNRRKMKNRGVNQQL